jgi:hypothetical protein
MARGGEDDDLLIPALAQLPNHCLALFVKPRDADFSSVQALCSNGLDGAVAVIRGILKGASPP